jgi:integrase
MCPLSAATVCKLLETAQVDNLEALYVLAIHTGKRHRELLGLEWPDVDSDNATARVRRTLTRTDDGERCALGEPKTKKIRGTVRLTQKAVEPSEATGQSRQITLDTHMLPEMSSEAADAMGEALE